MTYCVAMNLSEGLVFASDSRTNAGTDYVTSYSKMHRFTPAPDRLFVLLSAGNLATTQEVINRIKSDLDSNAGVESLLSARYMYEAADYVGRVTNKVQQAHANALSQAGVSGEVSWILGGQIQGQPHSLMLIYPQGNFIEASEATPYLQIGEAKYGKPVLDRILTYQTTLDEAARLALVSLNSTANSNITVGAPFEVSTYLSGTFQLGQHRKFETSGKYLANLENQWNEGLKQIFFSLPQIEWNVMQQKEPLAPVQPTQTVDTVTAIGSVNKPT